MNKKCIFVLLFISMIFITGCGKSKIDKMTENINKIELTGNLITYEAYYHNVIEYEKKAGVGVLHLFEVNRRLFAEYTGSVRFGINLSRVKITTNGNKINVFIPKAGVIGKARINEDDFKPENFIESEDGWLNKNPLTAEDSSKALKVAQNNMYEEASKDQNLLSIAQTRAKIVIEENINQLSGVSSKYYSINWEYEN